VSSGGCEKGAHGGIGSVRKCAARVAHASQFTRFASANERNE
jgi:hypothetical protein